MEEEGSGFLGSIIKKLESTHNADRQTWPQQQAYEHRSTAKHTKNVKIGEETKSLTGKQVFQVDLTILLHSFKFLVPLLIIPSYISSA